MVSLASVESNQDLATALKRLGKTWEAAGSIAQAQVRRFRLCSQFCVDISHRQSVITLFLATLSDINLYMLDRQR